MLGSDGHGQSSPPSGEFTAMASGSDHSCALSVDGTAHCWGSNFSHGGYRYHGQAAPPAGSSPP